MGGVKRVKNIEPNEREHAHLVLCLMKRRKPVLYRE
jgi:hypothetical protein